MTLPPRVVVVSRRSELDELLARHGTRGAAAYYLRQRGRDLGEVSARHDALEAALTSVGAAVPADWRRGRVDREDLPRFIFGPEDIVLAVGQDGLVANVAKYLDGQPVVGVDPEPGRNPGVLVRFPAAAVGAVLPAVLAGRPGRGPGGGQPPGRAGGHLGGLSRGPGGGQPSGRAGGHLGGLSRGPGDGIRTESRAMVRATLDDGQELVGLNEIYVGQPSHQSARYVLSAVDGRRERQSSSGIVASTGTGATGWCASIARDRAADPALPSLPAPEEDALCWFVREAWPSPATGVTLTAGRLSAGESLEIVSESERLVVFADGLEADRLAMAWGQRATVGLAKTRLRLVVPDH